MAKARQRKKGDFGPGPHAAAEFGAERLGQLCHQVRAVYESLNDQTLPERSCISRTTCCQFRLTGKTPMLTFGEAIYAAKGVRASGRTSLPESRDAVAGRCPLLNELGQCTIYEFRPLGCRTHFCKAAGGPYPRTLVRDQIRALETLAEEFQQTDPRPIAEAVEDGLRRLAKRRR